MNIEKQADADKEDKADKVAATFRLPKDLLRTAKVYAAKHDITLTDLVTEAFYVWLAAESDREALQQAIKEGVQKLERAHR